MGPVFFGPFEGNVFFVAVFVFVDGMVFPVGACLRETACNKKVWGKATGLRHEVKAHKMSQISGTEQHSKRLFELINSKGSSS